MVTPASEVRLLVVEDDSHVSKALELFFKSEGYQVATADNGMAALKLLKEGNFQPHIIVADVMMPEMDGFKLCEAIRQDQAFAGVSFLFLTALSQSEDRMKGYKTGADDYMTKPFKMEDLGLKVQTLLDIQFKRRPQAVFCSILKGMAMWMLPHEGTDIPTCLNENQCNPADRTSCPLAKAYPVHSF